VHRASKYYHVVGVVYKATSVSCMFQFYVRINVDDDDIISGRVAVRRIKRNLLSDT